MKHLIISLLLLSATVVVAIVIYNHLPEILANGLPFDPTPQLKAFLTRF